MTQPPKLLDHLPERIYFKDVSIIITDSYVHWVRCRVPFDGKCHPVGMVEGKEAAFRQNHV